jgi:hypothetical protein
VAALRALPDSTLCNAPLGIIHHAMMIFIDLSLPGRGDMLVFVQSVRAAKPRRISIGPSGTISTKPSPFGPGSGLKNRNQPVTILR